MRRDASGSVVKDIMAQFADESGLSSNGKVPRRYLWTDAFAVCNFLELYRQTGDEEYRSLALRLVEQAGSADSTRRKAEATLQRGG